MGNVRLDHDIETLHERRRADAAARPNLANDPLVAAVDGQASASASAARTVGDLVAEHLTRVLSEHENASIADPEAVAEAITDLLVVWVSDEDPNEIADLLAPFWTARRTAEALGGLRRSTMAERRKTGSLLGVKTTDGDFFYPVAQFERRDGKIQVKPALRKFMMALRDRDPWTVGILLHTPAPELGDLTPLDWVRRNGDEQRLVRYARIVDAEFTR